MEGSTNFVDNKIYVKEKKEQVETNGICLHKKEEEKERGGRVKKKREKSNQIQRLRELRQHKATLKKPRI